MAGINTQTDTLTKQFENIESAQKAVLNLKQAMTSAVGDNNPMSMEDAPYVSTIEPMSSPIHDTSKYELAYQAKAGLAQHITYALERTGQDGQRSNALLHHELEPFVTQLRDLRLPDTKINTGTQVIDLPRDIVDYANKVKVEFAIPVLHALIGEDLLVDLYKGSRLSGQDQKPTLWIAQKLYIEAKQPYVYTIRHAPDLHKVAESIDKTKIELSNEAVKELFGPVLYREFDQIGRSNEISPYAVFIILTSKILDRERAIRTPAKPAGAWDIISARLEA